MNYYLKLFLLIILCACQKNPEKKTGKNKNHPDFTISFGSCDNQNIPNLMWNEILKHEPDLFIWGGDIVYSDHQEISIMEKNYLQQKNDSTYQHCRFYTLYVYMNFVVYGFLFLIR